MHPGQRLHPGTGTPVTGGTAAADPDRPRAPPLAQRQQDREPLEMVKGPERFCCEESREELGLFSVESSRLREA